MIRFELQNPLWPMGGLKFNHEGLTQWLFMMNFFRAISEFEADSICAKFFNPKMSLKKDNQSLPTSEGLNFHCCQLSKN